MLGDAQESLAQINMSNLTDVVNHTPLTKIYGALRRYDEFREVRDKFRRLIRLAQAPSDQSRFGLLFFYRVPVHASLHIKNDGAVNISLDSFAEAINGIDAARIRECNDCQRIFWAKWKDQSCCSKECANRYHVRQHREKYASDPITYKIRRLGRVEKPSAKKGK